MSATTAGAAPAWSPDTDPAHALCHLLDCLLAALDRSWAVVYDRWHARPDPDRTTEITFGEDEMRAIRAAVLVTQRAVRTELTVGARERLTASTVARLVRAGDAASLAQPAAEAAARSLLNLLSLPADHIAKREEFDIQDAKAARDGLVMALARCGEPPPPHDWRTIADPAAALTTAFRPPGGATPSTSPPLNTPPTDPPEVADEPVLLHAPDGPGPNRAVRWRGREVRLTSVRHRVVSYMWTRDWVDFDELAAHVNAHRPHATPAPQGFKNWVHQGNKALAPLGLPRRLRVDTANRRIYWEELPDATPAGGGFARETDDETAATPA